MSETISVIIPVYNVEKYLNKCVDSVISQTYKDLQIILVDDGSTDRSSKICDEYAKADTRISVIHKQNGGLSSARNAGMEIVEGDYITFLDSDDYVSPTVYEELYKIIKSQDSDSIACTCFRRVDEVGNVYKKNDPHSKPSSSSNTEYLREILLHIGDVSVCTKLFPRKMLEIKRFDEEKLNEDLLFMADLIPSFKTIVYTGTVGYYYLVRDNSISSGYGKSVEEMAVNAVAVNKNVQSEYPELKDEGNRFALFQNMAYLLLIPQALRTKNNEKYFEALKYLKKTFFKNGITNRFLGIKYKIFIFVLIIYQEIVIRLFQRKLIK